VVDDTGLVEVGDASVFGARALQAALQAAQLGGEQFVVGGRGVRGERCLCGGDQLGAGEQVA
jgi:hypothetical protein